MNAIWYECKVKYRKTDGNGVQRLVTEPYLLDAVSYTDAEKRINEEMSAYVADEFKVVNIRPVNYAEVHNFENADYWFKSKVSLIHFDEDLGREKKVNVNLLIAANDVKEAYENTNEVMKNTMGDYRIVTVSETSIVEVFKYKEKPTE